MALLGISLLQFALISALAPQANPSSESLISAPISQVSMPAFVEEEHSVTFEVKTELPSSCYKLGPTSVRLDRDRRVVLFHISAIETKANCPAEPTQVVALVDAGHLREGGYEIRELKSLKKWGEIEVDSFGVSAISDLPKLELAARKH